ncbi:hypothetical protein, partial [Endozoicomonas atrinae]|uniref:hypothetical protein n=1 Tax=Endozoicomonas atrinae TaxID=1333660 RepID=UPI001EE6936C
LSFNLTGYLIYQFFVDFNAHCYSPFWSINDKRLHNLNYIPFMILAAPERSYIKSKALEYYDLAYSDAQLLLPIPYKNI